MVRPRLDDLAALTFPPGVKLHTYPQEQAIDHFRRLYEAAFAGLPSYQPYRSDAEVAQELEQPEDLLFLTVKEQPVGFAWLRTVDERGGEIEPLGLAKEFQGKGLGKLMLAAALHALAEGGYEQAQIGVWSNNLPAISLYRKLDFQQVGTRYFLAFDLGNSPHAVGPPGAEATGLKNDAP